MDSLIVPARARVPIPSSDGAPIADEEWQKWYDTIVQLYLDDELKLKDVVDTMAEKHNFVITERQLKHRLFKKWNIKKNIKRQDLAMLSFLVEKRKEAGTDAKIFYHGQDIAQDRIERTCKRRKVPSLLFPQVHPSSVNICMSPDQSPQVAQDFLDRARSAGGSAHNAVFLGGYRNAVLPGPNDIENNIDPSWRGSSFDNDVARRHYDFAEIAAPEGSTQVLLHSGKIRSGDSVSPHAGVMPAVIDTDLAMKLDKFTDDQFTSHATRDARERCLRTSDMEQAVYLSGRPDPHVMDGSIDRTPGTLQYVDWEHPMVSQGNTVSPLQLAWSSDISTVEVSRPQDDVVDGPSIRPLVPQGTDCETLIVTLQLLKLYLLKLSNHETLDSVAKRSFQGSNQAALLAIVSSDWLRMEVEDLLHWAYKTSARAIGRGRDANTGHDFESACHEYGPHQPSPRNRTTTEQDIRQSPQTKAISRFLERGASGMLAFEFNMASSGRWWRYPTYSTSPSMITVCSIPECTRRSTGVIISFALNSSPFEARIGPYIKTFNVVPSDSPIITSILKNDLQGVQKLFDEGKASPLDVDPHGGSLLQYTMYAGDTDVFRLLLRGGAGTQNLRFFDYELDFVWTLWISFVDYNYGTYLATPEGPDRIIGDFDQCARMTEAALEHGCDVENVMRYDPIRPTLLFDLAGRWPLGMVKFPAFVKALRYLVAKGYDMEERNLEGDTPLLLATKVYEPHVVTCIKAFIEAGSDIHAINRAGQGALHCVLAAPDGVPLSVPASSEALVNWNAPEFEANWIDTPNYHYWCTQEYYTERNDHASDYDDDGFEQYPLLYRDGAEKAEGDGPANELSIDYIFCRDDNWDEQVIQNPVQVLKKRLRFKILTLLEGGCDPNLVNKAGKTPNHYAEREGIWPQWSWALINSGYRLDEGSGRWVRGSP